MKIKRFKKLRKNLMGLFLFKYLNNQNYLNINNNDILCYLNQVFKIISNFHCYNKKILFIFPDNLDEGYNFINKVTSFHSSIFKSQWVSGIIGNNNKLVMKHKKEKFLRPDLVVIFGIDITDRKIVNELKKFDLPIIGVGFVSSIFLQNNDLYYCVPFQVVKQNAKILNFCCFLISFLLNRQNK